MRRFAAVILVASATAWPSSTPLAQAPAGPLTDVAREEFLRTARVLRTRQIDQGVTRSLRATLSDGQFTHEAHIQTVDQTKFEFRTKEGVEFNFRDSWTFNIAAYKIDRLLGLHLVPVTVARVWGGSQAAFTWWVDDVMMDEGGRIKKQLRAPNQGCWDAQTRLLRMFDQLIENTDRNLGNLLITNGWRIWAIDHTRAFRRSAKPKSLTHLTLVDRNILERLAALDSATLKREVGRYLKDPDIRALLSRRDAIVTHFQAMGPAVVVDRQDATSTGCPAE